ncbi:MAG: hypothetical protein HQL95_11135 [Magnetococcales bacterium]|nr:hypothetical protein [Magnetococcales bacterium]
MIVPDWRWVVHFKGQPSPSAMLLASLADPSWISNCLGNLSAGYGGSLLLFFLPDFPFNLWKNRPYRHLEGCIGTPGQEVEWILAGG